MENITREKKEATVQKDVFESLGSLSKQDWEEAGWPLVCFIPKSRFFIPEDSTGHNIKFWEEIFDTRNFLNPVNKDKYNPRKHTLFVLHSFLNSEGQESVFKAITTSPSELSEDPRYMVDYEYHGRPCEVRSHGSYPTCNDFWKDFYDKLPYDKQDNYPIPSKELRRKLILSQYFNE